MIEMKPGTFCPLLKKDCIGLKCSWITHIRGTEPNSGKEVDHWGCAIATLPMLLMENANQVRQGAAATESFRNEMVRAHEATVEAMLHVASLPAPETPMRLVDDSRPRNDHQT